MISFPNAKINLGLYITAKRTDGYHDIATVMVPCRPADILEFVEWTDSLVCTGLETGACNADNLVIKALHLLREEHPIPPLAVHLHKAIPTGAGLGGGSSDAAYMLKTLDAAFNLGLGEEDSGSGLRLGSDCAFFIDNRPALATGRGEILEPFPFLRQVLFMVLVNPGFPVSTKEAYAGVTPARPRDYIGHILSMPVKNGRTVSKTVSKNRCSAFTPESAA